MKKIISILFASLLAASANAQQAVSTSTGENADNKVIVDAASPVAPNTASATSAPQDADTQELNRLVSSINQKLEKVQSLEKRITSLQTEVIRKGNDPYNGHEYVDLGTGVKWATMNVGAKSPEDFGDYFAWGENKGYKNGKTYFSENNYAWYDEEKGILAKYNNLEKYGPVDNKVYLELQDDAAHVNWGGSWHTPSPLDFEALSAKCYWKWVTSYNGKSVNGFIVYKAKAEEDKGVCAFTDATIPKASYSISDTHIFLPAAESIEEDRVVDQCGMYWTSWIYSAEPWASYLYYFDARFENKYYSVYYRTVGMSVRAVCE